MRFDWYQATVEEAPGWLKAALKDHSGGRFEEVKPFAKARRAHALMVADRPVLHVLEEGVYKAPHILSTGEMSDQAAQLVRAVAPSHLVSRADVCEDLEAPDFFNKAFGIMVDLSLADRVKPQRMGDWDSPDLERTFYLGHKSSDVRVRLYEKGKQMRVEDPGNADSYSPDWVRLETQVRPSKREAKLAMSSRPAAEFWGCARWSQKLANRLLDVDAPRVAIGAKWNPIQDQERSEHYMVLQYGAILERRATLEGSEAAVGPFLLEMYRTLKARGL